MAGEDANIFRRVYFFRVEHFDEVRESLPLALARVSELEFEDSGRYKFDPSSNLRLSAYPDTATYPLKLRFGRIRRDALPQVERAGDLSTLELQEDAGLIDLSHVVIFDNGYVAAEWNPEGPKLAALGAYLFEKGRLNTVPRFLSLVERDIVDVVRRLDSVRVLEIDLPPDAIELAREADENLAAAIKATAAMGATKRTGLVLTADKPTTRLRDLAVRLAQTLKRRPQESKDVKNLAVRGYGDGSRVARYIDILESKLVAAEDFPRTSDRARSVKSVETYAILQRLFNENLDRIISAAGTSDLP